MNFGTTLANMLIGRRQDLQNKYLPSIHEVDNRFEAITQFELGTMPSQERPKRTRKQIYTLWQRMQTDPQIAEALSLHVTAALGGHETTGDMIFISPHERVRGSGMRAKSLRERVEREAKVMTPMINRMAFTLARQAVGYGDSYARVYADKRVGVVDLMNNEYTAPPLILPFEQGGRTVGFFVLEMENWGNVVSRLTKTQMLRVKMARIEQVPQVPLAQWVVEKQLDIDSRLDMPIVPSPVGGSFLYPVEEAWEKAMLNLLALNNQQIADSVKQNFLLINMEGMPPSQQKQYKQGLIKTLQNYRDRIEKAFKGGEEIYGTSHHVLPTWGDKQNISSLGDISSRQSPLSTETLMLNLRRVAGGLGMDLALIGWADMLAGGLGDGAMFHTSAQIMRRSMLIRQALIDGFNDLMMLHWGLKYGEYFKDGDFPWRFDFYSDQSAAATESLNNKQTRMNMLMLRTQALQSLRDLGVGEEMVQLLLEDDGGMDFDTAKKFAKDLSQSSSSVDNVSQANDNVDFDDDVVVGDFDDFDDDDG